MLRILSRADLAEETAIRKPVAGEITVIVPAYNEALSLCGYDHQPPESDAPSE